MFRKLLVGAIAFSVLGLAACGGGGSGGGSGGGTSVPTLNVSLSATSGSAEVSEGATATGLTVTATSSGHVSTTVVPDLQYDHAVFASVMATAAATAGTYVVTARTLPNLDIGVYKGNITFRLCEESGCTHVYTGSDASFNYTVSVDVKDWSTEGRTGDHAGYVPITLDPSKFTEAWRYEVNHVLSPVVTGNGMIYLVENWGASNGSRYYGQLSALKAADGSAVWSYDLGNPDWLGEPATGDGNVFVSNHLMFGDTHSHFLDGKTGTLIKDVTENSNVVPGGLATPYADKLYASGGFGSTMITSYEMSTGAQTWRQSVANLVERDQGVAVDEAHVFDYDHYNLNVYDRVSGVKLYSINDPYSDGGVMSQPPVIGNGFVFAQADPKTISAGMHINAFNIDGRAAAWASEEAYALPVAYAQGIIYASRKYPAKLDALDEKTGTVLWSWTPSNEGGAYPNDVFMTGNILVTKNLVFVSTAQKLYAIDLATHATVWTYDQPGWVAIGPGNRLYINVGGFDYIAVNIRSIGKLIALNLK